MARPRHPPDQPPAAAPPLAQLLLPVVRLWLEAGGSITDFNELVRQTFVLAAGEMAKLGSGRVNASAVAARTGLSRAEVNRLLRASPAVEAQSPHASRAVRVLEGWKRDPRFLTAGGRPRSLPLKGARGSFHELVRLYSGDVPPRPILNELCRLGLARLSARDRVTITAPNERNRVPVEAALASLQLLQTLLTALPPRALELPDTLPRIVAIPVGDSRRVRQVGREVLTRLDTQLAGLKAAFADPGVAEGSASPQVLLLSLAAWLPR